MYGSCIVDLYLCIVFFSSPYPVYISQNHLFRRRCFHQEVLPHSKRIQSPPRQSLGWLSWWKQVQVAAFGYHIHGELNRRLVWQGQSSVTAGLAKLRGSVPWRHQTSLRQGVWVWEFSSPNWGAHRLGRARARVSLGCRNFIILLHRWEYVLNFPYHAKRLACPTGYTPEISRHTVQEWSSRDAGH